MVDAEYHAYVNDVLRQAGGFYEGRTTYELMADFWPTADEDPDAEPEIVDFAGIWRDMPKWVVSTTIESAGWGTEIVRSIDADAVRALADELDGPLIVGGANVASQLLDLDLIDEIQLYVHPVVVGGGTRMFQSTVQRHYPLLDTHVFGNGCVRLRYGC
jgi:dihydrofolate reductase